nr:hypothetical protein [Streptomyces ipomoeae]
MRSFTDRAGRLWQLTSYAEIALRTSVACAATRSTRVACRRPVSTCHRLPRSAFPNGQLPADLSSLPDDLAWTMQCANIEELLRGAAEMGRRDGVQLPGLADTGDTIVNRDAHAEAMALAPDPQEWGASPTTRHSPPRPPPSPLPTMRTEVKRRAADDHLPLHGWDCRPVGPRGPAGSPVAEETSVDRMTLIIDPWQSQSRSYSKSQGHCCS